MDMKWAVFILAAVLLLLGASSVWAQGAGDVADELVCQCGCNLILSQCNHEECSVKDAMLREIGDLGAQGMSRDGILRSFVAKYGEKVLAAPPTKGFNLTAWLAPFAGLVAGGVLVSLLLRRWVLRARPAETEETAGVEDEYRRRVDEELRRQRSS